MHLAWKEIAYCAALLLFVPEWLRAQLRAQSHPVRFDLLATESGLSSNKVRGIVQDRQGFLWISTQDGLNRYDGYQFTVFRHQPGNPNSLQPTELKEIYLDGRGQLWIVLLSGGLNLYDPVTEQFTFFGNQPHDPGSLSSNDVTVVHTGKDGGVWVGTRNGLNRYDPDTRSFRRYLCTPDGTGKAGQTITSLAEDARGNLWIGTRNQLHVLNKSTQQVICLDTYTQGAGLTNPSVNSLLIDSEEYLWVGTDWGLNRSLHPLSALSDPRALSFRQFMVPYTQDYDGVSRSGIRCLIQTRHGDIFIGTSRGITRFRQQGGVIQSIRHYLSSPQYLDANGDHFIGLIREDSQGTVWAVSAGYENGVFRLSQGESEFEHLTSDPLNPDGLRSNGVSCLFEDRSKVLWLGTARGLSRLDLMAKPFRHYRQETGNPNSLNSNMVLSVYEDADSILWIGTVKGLNRLDRRTGVYRHYEHDPQRKTGIAAKIVGVISPSPEGYFWLGYFDYKVSKFYPDQERFEHYPNQINNPQAFQPWSLRSIYTDRSGTTWMGATIFGLTQYLPQSNTFRYHLPRPTALPTAIDNWVWTIYEDTAGNLWAGTRLCGLVQFNRSTQQFTYYTHQAGQINSLSSNDIRSIAEYPAGVLWLGTSNGGLNRLEPATGQVRRYDTRAGLPNPTVHGILPDEKGYLWLSTNKGISRFDPRTETFRNFNTSHGLLNDEYNEGAFFRSKSGELFFGGLNGLTAFRPADIVDNPWQPPVRLTQFRLFNQPVIPGDTLQGSVLLRQAISYARQLTLTHRQNDFTLEFAALQLTGGSAIRYAYQLEGYDQTWKYTDASQRYASYTNLPPGRYLFKVKSTNADGIWNSHCTRLHLTILPAWWQTGWFRTLAAVLTLGSLYGIYRVRTRRLQAQKIALEGTVRQRTAELLEQQREILNQKEEIEQQYKTIHSLGSLGQQITASLRIPEIISRVYVTINEMMDAPSLAVGQLNAEQTEVAFWGYTDADSPLSSQCMALDDPERLSAWCLRNRQTVCIGDAERESADFFHKKVTGYTRPGGPRSCLYLPLYSLENRVIGILVAKSYSPHRYNGLHLNLLKNLGAYIAIALDNARVYKELEKMDELKTRFFYNVSHEFRTPLTLLLGPLQQLRESPFLQASETDRRYLDLMSRNGQQLQKLINQMLEIRKLREGKLRLETTEGDLVAFVKGFLPLFGDLARQQGLSMSFSASVAQLICWFDRHKLEQIFYNLLSNAIKFTDRGGSIQLTVHYVRPNEDFPIEITLADTGRGIPAAALPYLFDRFYQAPDSQTALQEGSGIGLSLTRELVTLHGGKISVTSQEGRGTRFLVQLPFVSAPTGQLVQEMPPHAPKTPEESVQEPDEQVYLDKTPSQTVAPTALPLVLLVEDHPDLRIYLKTELSPLYRVIEAADGAAGWQQCLEQLPDLIVSDVMMPVMDGIALCREVKNDERTSHIPVLLLTAKAGEASQLAGLENGADDYVLKPFGMRLLKARIRNLIRSRQRLQERLAAASIPQTLQIAGNTRDQAFLTRLYALVEEQLANPELNHTVLARELGFSKANLYKKIQALSGQTVHEFIRNIRLKKAHQLLQEQNLRVSEVAYAVGFKDHATFTRSFQQFFGRAPREVGRQLGTHS